LTVRVFDRTSDKVELTMTGIRTEQLTSSRAISNLVAGLRADLQRSHSKVARASHA
jgi:hypothetical protein